ncbi:HAMP domain-containing sensor histidine kinase [Shinella sp.]|uniref:sensor histidine kinase n=1 Tax=Shinella sp. TaxID=1870904 RepID=UPI00301E3C2C
MTRIRDDRQPSISRRLITFSVVFVSATMLVAAVILYLIVASVVREQVDRRLDTQIEGLRGALSAGAEGDAVLNASMDAPPFDRQGSGWYWQVLGSGVEITSRSLAGATIDNPPHPFDWRHTLGGEPQTLDKTAFHGETLYSRTAKAIVGEKTVDITVTSPRSALVAPARRALMWLIPVMALLGASLVAGIFWQVRYGLYPLRQLASDLSAISAGTRDRVSSAEVVELKPVTRQINRLIEQNEERLAQTRLHFANLAHALKTPVASLSMALDPANDPGGELRALVDRIDQRIRYHLSRARKIASGGINAATPIRPRVDDILLVMSRLHADRGIEAKANIPIDLKVACAAEDLDEILGNLIDNAFKWARNNVDISARKDGTDITFTIADDGPGIADTNAAEAFLPGKRLDETVPGDGFGLTIAKELVELYGGEIKLLPSENRGTVWLLVLPNATAR